MARVLVIDDDDSLLQMMGMMIKRAGYEVITRNTARTGIETGFAEQPDLIIVDVMMPELNGFQACRVFRTNPRTKHIPLMVLTALHGHDYEADAMASGADVYLTKPITMEILREEVEKLLTSGPINLIDD
jgi:DNA-binding response OmpR family regulator